MFVRDLYEIVVELIGLKVIPFACPSCRPASLVNRIRVQRKKQILLTPRRRPLAFEFKKGRMFAAKNAGDLLRLTSRTSAAITAQTRAEATIKNKKYFFISSPLLFSNLPRALKDRNLLFPGRGEFPQLVMNQPY
jgi:hypothetical protein